MKKKYIKWYFTLFLVLGITACTSSENIALKLPPDELATTINAFGVNNQHFHDAAAMCSNFYANPNEHTLLDASLKKMCPEYINALKKYLNDGTQLKGLSESDLQQPAVWQHYMLSKKAHGRGFN